jgi:hypothetical protein
MRPRRLDSHLVALGLRSLRCLCHIGGVGMFTGIGGSFIVTMFRIIGKLDTHLNTISSTLAIFSSLRFKA